MAAWSRNWYFVFALAAFVASSEACAYRLYAPVPPSEERVRLVARNPNRYVLHIEEVEPTVPKSKASGAPHVHVARVANYQIPTDGQVTIRIPSYRPNCGVYLFNVIRVGGAGDDALKLWEVSILSGVRAVRVLSLKQVRDLPTDEAGYRMLKILD